MCRAPRTRRKGAARVINTDLASETCALFLPHTGQLHEPCKRESGSAWVLARTMSVVWLAWVFSTGRVREACALIFGVARGVLSSTRTVLRELHGSRFRFTRGMSSGSSICTGHAIWHGSRSFLHGSSLFLHGVCDFPSSEVGSPNFSQYSELVMIWY